MRTKVCGLRLSYLLRSVRCYAGVVVGAPQLSLPVAAAVPLAPVLIQKIAWLLVGLPSAAIILIAAASALKQYRRCGRCRSPPFGKCSFCELTQLPPFCLFLPHARRIFYLQSSTVPRGRGRGRFPALPLQTRKSTEAILLDGRSACDASSQCVQSGACSSRNPFIVDVSELP